MVQEVRSILFTAEEGHAAVTVLLALRDRGLRPEQVVHVEFGDKPVSASATLRAKDGAETIRTLTTDDLMSAALLYCRRAHIPLSTRSHKRLNLVSGCLALTTSINLRAAAPVVTDGAIIHARSGPDLAMMHRV